MIKITRPKVSVIMGIYNCESTLEESLNSLIWQSFGDFNVIMCDDGSTDNTFKIAGNYCDNFPDKFILLKNQKNMGLNYTLNACLKVAKGDYIARMDGDDISLPERFQKEVDFLDNNLDISIVSTAMIYFDELGEWGVGKPNLVPQKKDFVKETPHPHAPCMVRRKAYESVNGYTVDQKLLRVEDYHLWIKMYAKGFRGYNIQEPLYKMRDDQNAIKRRNFKGRINEFNVKCIAIRELKLPLWTIFFAFRPIILAFLPQEIYRYLHKRRMRDINS